MKTIDFMQIMEKDGFKIVFDCEETIPQQGDFGTIFRVLNYDNNVHFVGIATYKTMGEWIKIHGKAS